MVWFVAVGHGFSVGEVISQRRKVCRPLRGDISGAIFTQGLTTQQAKTALPPQHAKNRPWASLDRALRRWSVLEHSRTHSLALDGPIAIQLPAFRVSAPTAPGSLPDGASYAAARGLRSRTALS